MDVLLGTGRQLGLKAGAQNFKRLHSHRQLRRSQLPRCALLGPRTHQSSIYNPLQQMTGCQTASSSHIARTERWVSSSQLSPLHVPGSEVLPQLPPLDAGTRPAGLQQPVSLTSARCWVCWHRPLARILHVCIPDCGKQLARQGRWRRCLCCTPRLPSGARSHASTCSCASSRITRCCCHC